VLGAPRQLDLVAGHTKAEARHWPSPMLPALPALFAELAGQRCCDAVSYLSVSCFDVVSSGVITALHYAAGAGELAVIELRLKHGADPTIRDTQFNHPAAEWARFHRREAAAALLK
jgi:hypothetical protein